MPILVAPTLTCSQPAEGVLPYWVGIIWTLVLGTVTVSELYYESLNHTGRVAHLLFTVTGADISYFSLNGRVIPVVLGSLGGGEAAPPSGSRITGTPPGSCGQS